MNRRLCLALVILAGLAVAVGQSANAASFAGQTLHVQQWPTGPEAEALKKYVIDPFAKETGANIVVEYGHTTASIAKIRAQKGDPQLDVVLMDDIGVYTLAQEGLLDKLDLSKMKNAKDVYPAYVIADGHGIGVTTYVATIHTTRRPCRRRLRHGTTFGIQNTKPKLSCRRRMFREHRC